MLFSFMESKIDFKLLTGLDSNESIPDRIPEISHTFPENVT